MTTPFPNKDSLRICFAHVAYALSETLQKRNTGISNFQVWDADSLKTRSDYDVLVISGLWNNDILASAPDLRFYSPSARDTTSSRLTSSAAGASG